MNWRPVFESERLTCRHLYHWTTRSTVSARVCCMCYAKSIAGSRRVRHPRAAKTIWEMIIKFMRQKEADYTIQWKIRFGFLSRRSHALPSALTFAKWAHAELTNSHSKWSYSWRSDFRAPFFSSSSWSSPWKSAAHCWRTKKYSLCIGMLSQLKTVKREDGWIKNEWKIGKQPKNEMCRTDEKLGKWSSSW